MAGLDSYFQAKPFDYSEFTEFDMNSSRPRRQYYGLIRHQEAIGWDHFLRGKLSHHWTLLQQDFVWCTSQNKKLEIVRLGYTSSFEQTSPCAKIYGRLGMTNNMVKMPKQRRASTLPKPSATYVHSMRCEMKL
jgi:hypothetical protein